MGYFILADSTKIDNVDYNGATYETDSTDIAEGRLTADQCASVVYYLKDNAPLRSYTNAIFRVIKKVSEGETVKSVVSVYSDYAETDNTTYKISVISGLVLTDAQSLAAPFLFAEWSPDSVSYTANVSKVRYNDILYKCIQSHTSQSTWTPKDAASLWTRMDDPTVEWPEWRQPTGSTDAYAKGAKVSHNGKHWVSTLDANVWEPGVSGWEEQKDSDANATA